MVFEDWDGLRGRVACGVPGGSRIVAAVDAIAAACRPGPLSGQDLVHGNFYLADTIAAAGRLWAYAAGLDRREFAVCAGSIALTMAESFVRHGRAGQAAGAVSEMARALTQALSLAGA